MSIFKSSKDCTVDDSVALTCTIESAYNLKDHTVRRYRSREAVVKDGKGAFPSRQFTPGVFLCKALTRQR